MQRSVVKRTIQRTTRGKGRRVVRTVKRLKTVRPRLLRKPRRFRKIKIRNTRQYRQNMLQPSVRQYMHCRMNPFGSHGGAQIPDISNRQRCTVDHRLIVNFLPGTSGGFRIAVMPWLPHPLLVQPLAIEDATWQINGVHSASPAITTHDYWYAPVTLTEWANQSVMRNAELWKIDGVDVPYNSKSFRFVTIGAKLIYTGATMNNQGTVLVNDGAFDIKQPEINNGAISVADLTSWKTWDPDQVYTAAVSFNPNFQTKTNSGYNGSLKSGSFMLLVNQAGDHPWQPIYNQLTFPYMNSMVTNCAVVSNASNVLSQTTIGGYPCVQGADPNWAPKLIQVAGCNSGSSFQLELCYCVEYAIDSSSSVASFSSKPTPHPLEVQRVDAIIQQQPPNRSLAEAAINAAGNVVTNVANNVADHIFGTPRPQRVFTNSKYQRPMITDVTDE